MFAADLSVTLPMLNLGSQRWGDVGLKIWLGVLSGKRNVVQIWSHETERKKKLCETWFTQKTEKAESGLN
jgi:hypothetical protein